MTSQTTAGLAPQALDPGPGPVDIGQCRSVKVTCISEVGWWDDKKILGPIKAAGGLAVADQWTTPGDPANAAGSSSLIEVEGLDGSWRRILLDVGWHPAYMAWRLQATGVDRMLKEDGVQALLISHEHFDHFWGLEATLGLNAALPLMVPSTFSLSALKFIYGGRFPAAGTANHVPFQGQLIKAEPGRVHRLWEGAAAVTFDLPIILGIRGEQSLYFNVQDKGLVVVTGCCHQGVPALLDFARDNIQGGQRLHGLYGGLHLAPFGALEPDKERVIADLAGYGLKVMACNHCTGQPAVARMLELGYPVQGGTANQGSKSALYVGNGDSVLFG